MEYKFTSTCEEDTIKFAKKIELKKFINMIICLDGELGTGKTVFTKGFANALGITDTITSPTFTIIKEYDSEFPLYHMDAYRIDDSNIDIGIEEYFDKGGVCIIEWAENIKSILPNDYLHINIKALGENTRLFIINANGKQYEELCEDIL